MKKVLPLLITAALLCTGCQSQSSAENDSESTTSATQPSTAASEVLSPAQGNEMPAESWSDTDEDTADAVEKRFITGTYLLNDGDVHIGYMFALEAEDPLAMFYTFDAGFETEVTYKIANNQIELNGENDSVILDVLSGDLSVFDFRTADGLEFNLRYFSESMPDEILGNFYSNPKLCEIALDYYEKNHGCRPTSCDAENNADGTVTLHLYDNMEDHIATLAWYTVDRTSCAGTDDVMLTEINLLS